MVREGRVFISALGTGKPAFGSNYYVQALEVGAQVTAGSSGTTVTVAAGHGFAAGDKYMKSLDAATYSGLSTVASVTSTTLTLDSALTVSDGDVLINLGADTGSTTPNYDGNGVVIYSDMDYSTSVTNATVTADSNGRYVYHHKGVDRWELVRTGTTLISLYQDCNQPSDLDRVDYQIRYAHLFATSGTGTLADPWVTSGSNPLQAAFNDLPAAGVGGRGTVRMVSGCYSLGSGATGFVADGAGSHLFGFTLEGVGKGSRVSRQGGVNVGYVNDDGVVLLYSGTGAAIKVGEFSTTGSKVAEGCTLRNFKVRQTGTAGTGVGIMLRLFRSGNVEDVNVTDFSTGVSLSSVSDFNTFIRVQTNDCQSYGIDLARNTDESGAAMQTPNGQNNANWFSGCGVSLTSRDNGYNAYGFRIDGNAVKTVIRDSWIQNFDTSGYAGILVNSAVTSSPSDTTTIDSCYFEGCYTACLFNNPNATGTPTFGLTFSNNYVTQIEGYGIFVQSGSTGETDGVSIQGNVFTTPSSSSPYNSAVGIQLGTYTQNCVLLGNHFNVNNVTGTLAGGNIKHGSLGTITQNNFTLGTSRFHGATSFTGGLMARSVTATITASTTQTQGQGALTSDINEVSVCANVNDTVTLPTAVAGQSVTIINNGAQTLRIYPASGDNLGAGVDTATTLAAGSNVKYTAYDATNWEAV